jgi:hypothetical protein
MCWINLAATRYELRRSAEQSLNDWEGAARPGFGVLRPALLPLLSGNRELVARALPLSARLLRQFYSEVDEDLLGTPPVLPNLVGLSVAAHLAGEDQSRLWRRVAEAAEFADPVMRELQRVVAALCGARPFGGREQAEDEWHVTSEEDWLWRLGHAPARRLFDLAASPDHELWPYDLDSFVLPLGLLWHGELAASGAEFDPLKLYSQGAYPERHTGVIYERQQPRPDHFTVPEPQQPSTWYGFDAVELREGRLLAYHYLGFGWRAPLLFEGSLNAFQFLDSLSLSWQLLQSSLPEEQWREVSALERSGRCTHVIVCDMNYVNVSPPHLERAARHYGIALEARDITLV